MACEPQSLQLLALGLSLFCDVLFALFPVPFLPAMLERDGYSNFSIGFLMAMVWTSSLFAYIALCAAQVHYDLRGRKRWILLSACSLGVTLSSWLTVFAPSYGVFLFTRAIQGVASAVFWTYAMMLSGEMQGTVWCAVEPMSIVLAFSTLGQISGPVFGSLCYNAVGKRVGLAYLPISIVSVLLSALLGFVTSRMPLNDSATATAAAEGGVGAISNTAELAQSSAGGGASGGQYRLLGSDAINSSSSSAKSANAPSVRERWEPVLSLLSSPVFLALSSTLFMVSVPLTALQVILPLRLEDQFDASSLTVGIIFGCAACSDAIGSMAAGRVLHACRQIRHEKAISLQQKLVTFAALVLSAIGIGAAAVSTVTGIGVLFALFCYFELVCENTVMAQIEKLAEVVKAQNAVKADPIVTIACLIWTGGFALGGVLGGIPSTGAGQVYMMLGIAGAAVLWVVFVYLGVLCRSGLCCRPESRWQEAADLAEALSLERQRAYDHDSLADGGGLGDANAP